MSIGATGSLFRHLNLVGAFRELGSSKQRGGTLIALASTQLLVQLSSMPVALTIPSVARYFNADVSEAAWMVIIRLLMLGSTVFLAARLGERYGHVRVYFAGAIIMTVASALAAASPNLVMLIAWSGLVGLGGALVTANSNAILTLVFNERERGRAFSVPITSAQMGSMLGVAIFGVFLQYLSWRLVFLASLPVGLIAIRNSYPLLRYRLEQAGGAARKVPISYFSALLMVAALSVFILSGSHLHEGPESFTSREALDYHLPMDVLALTLLALFITLQLQSKQPFLDLRYFKEKYFSMALFSNTTFHLSMLAVMTLIPIMVEDGLGMGPTAVSLVLVPHQSMGLVLPALAGWVYDRYSPRWLRPASLLLIAMGIGLVGVFGGKVPIWGLPMLLWPASIGSALFNSPNNALVMNSLPQDRSFASGMLETTRQMGHTIGATIAATVMGFILPTTIDLLPSAEAQAFYREGFRHAALVVVWIMVAGALVALFQRLPEKARAGAASRAVQQASGGDD